MFNKFDDEYFKPISDVRDSYHIPVIERIDHHAGQRLYLTETGLKYPSMSTVTSLLSKQAIADWRKRVGADEANKIGARAGRRGTDVHKLAEHYCLNEKDQFIAAYRKSMPDTQSNWGGMKEVVDQYISEVRASECQLYSDALRMAGTTDLIGLFDGKLSVIDFKTSMKWKERSWIDGYFIQCDGYGAMWEERTGETPEQSVIIIATDVKRSPQVFVEPYGQSLPALKNLRLEYFKQFGV